MASRGHGLFFTCWISPRTSAISGTRRYTGRGETEKWENARVREREGSRDGENETGTGGTRGKAEKRHFMRFFRRGVSFAIIYAGRQLEK